MSWSFILIGLPLMVVFGLVLPGALVWSAIVNHSDETDGIAMLVGLVWLALGLWTAIAFAVQL